MAARSTRRAAAGSCSPAFTADGTTLYFAASEGDAPFEIRAVDLGPGGTRDGSAAGVIRPGRRARPLPGTDGRIVYVGYTTAGYDLFEQSRSARWQR